MQILGADEIYHVLRGEAHQVAGLTRMVLYRVQAGADRTPRFFEEWPA